jgi:hypothetical protein
MEDPASPQAHLQGALASLKSTARRVRHRYDAKGPLSFGGPFSEIPRPEGAELVALGERLREDLAEECKVAFGFGMRPLVDDDLA